MNSLTKTLNNFKYIQWAEREHRETTKGNQENDKITKWNYKQRDKIYKKEPSRLIWNWRI